MLASRFSSQNQTARATDHLNIVSQGGVRTKTVAFTQPRHDECCFCWINRITAFVASSSSAKTLTASSESDFFNLFHMNIARIISLLEKSSSPVIFESCALLKCESSEMSRFTEYQITKENLTDLLNIKPNAIVFFNLLFECFVFLWLRILHRTS